MREGPTLLHFSKTTTLPKTKSSHLKMDGWNTKKKFPCGMAHFQVLSTVSFREGNGSIDIFWQGDAGFGMKSGWASTHLWLPSKQAGKICGLIPDDQMHGLDMRIFMYFHRSMHIVFSSGSQLCRFLFVLSDCEH